MQLVTIFQVNLVQPRVRAVERIHVKHVLTTVALEGQAGQVRSFGVHTCLADGLGDGHRGRGDGHFACGVECTGNDNTLAAETQDGNVYLRAVDVVGQATSNGSTQLFDRFAGGIDVADVRIEEGAIRANQAAVGIQLLLRAGRCGQFRVVPNSDIEEVVRADAVGTGLVAQQFLLARRTHVGCQFAFEHFGCDADQLHRTVFGFGAILELIGIEVLTGGESAALQRKGGSKSKSNKWFHGLFILDGVVLFQRVRRLDSLFCLRRSSCSFAFPRGSESSLHTPQRPNWIGSQSFSPS